MRHRHLARALVALASIAASAAVAATAPPAELARENCFLSQDWTGWKATPDSKSVYIRVAANRIYRLDLARECVVLNTTNVHLLTETRGSPWICRPVDLNFRVADDYGFKSACIVSGITALTPAEAKALPNKLKP